MKRLDVPRRFLVAVSEICFMLSKLLYNCTHVFENDILGMSVEYSLQYSRDIHASSNLGGYPTSGYGNFLELSCVSVPIFSDISADPIYTLYREVEAIFLPIFLCMGFVPGGKVYNDPLKR